MIPTIMNKIIKNKTKDMDFEEELDEELKDPQFKKYYDMFDRQLRLAYSIHLLRKEAGLSQREFAEKLDMKQSNVARIESGSENPTLATLNKIAERFGKKLEISFV